jgi:hypothetical protein
MVMPTVGLHSSVCGTAVSKVEVSKGILLNPTRTKISIGEYLPINQRSVGGFAAIVYVSNQIDTKTNPAARGEMRGDTPFSNCLLSFL